MLPDGFRDCTDQLRHCGLRRLWVVSGETAWCEARLHQLRDAAPGDWPVISAQLPGGVLPSQARLLLGQEFRHGVFDARDGLHSEALAMLAGTLQAGSWLVLLLPPETQWQTRPDSDSLRWHDGAVAIAAPRFMQHLARTFADASVVRDTQGQNLTLHLLPERPLWLPPDGSPTAAQQQILTQLQQAARGIFGLPGGRGRGKSAVAGLFLAGAPGRHLLCAPAKVSATVIQQWLAGSTATEFISPDNLLRLAEQGDTGGTGWLVIDEAAMIPLPMLARIVTAFPRVLMLSTVQGYEGTGRGFLLKFCDSLPGFTLLTLTTPVRWAADDPLENWLSRALLLDEPAPGAPSAAPFAYLAPSQQALCDDPALLARFYGLLTAAHYRTSPLDLRRLTDTTGQYFSLYRQGEDVVAALWLTEEGGLSAALAEAVWAGTRRPPGNLLVQSLAAHSYFPQAAQLHSRRISRIAVASRQRRHALGRRLLQQAAETGRRDGLDFLSVSFGYTPELAAFWLACGFRTVRMGTHTEASSGCYTAMTLFPLSAAGEQLCTEAEQQFARDCTVFRRTWGFTPVTPVTATALNEREWQMLAGFAFANKPLAVAEPALRLLQQTADRVMRENAPLLCAALSESGVSDTLLREHQVSGKKALLRVLRAETAAVLTVLHPEQTQQQERMIRAF